MQAILHNGWIAVPYSGSERSVVRIAVGDPDGWLPAYFHWIDGERVVQVRPPAKTGKQFVWLSVDGQVTKLGTVQL